MGDNGSVTSSATKIVSMMAKRMGPGDVSTYYSAISMSIAESLPEELSTARAVTNIMGAITCEAIQCWALLGKEDIDSPYRFIGTVTTQIIEDRFTGSRNIELNPYSCL